MGGMKFNEGKQCGTRCKELGPMVGVSLRPAATYDEVVETAKQQFFADLSSDKERYDYFLADPQGSKLMNTIADKPWNLAQYLHYHGYFPSKTKLYLVQVHTYRTMFQFTVMCSMFLV